MPVGSSGGGAYRCVDLHTKEVTTGVFSNGYFGHFTTPYKLDTTDPTASTVHREENMECEYNFTAPTNMFVYFQLPSCALRATFDCLLENVRIPMQFGDSVVHNVVCGPGQPVSNASTITGLTTVSVRFRSHLTAASPAPPCVGLFFACKCRPSSLWKTKCTKKASKFWLFWRLRQGFHQKSVRGSYRAGWTQALNLWALPELCDLPLVRDSRMWKHLVMPMCEGTLQGFKMWCGGGGGGMPVDRFGRKCRSPLARDVTQRRLILETFLTFRAVSSIHFLNKFLLVCVFAPVCLSACARVFVYKALF